MGIPDPVTRESHGTGDKYFTELARQLASVLENPIKVRSQKHKINHIYQKHSEADKADNLYCYYHPTG